MAHPHDWTDSTLGHGNRMCRRCFVTDLEAAVLGTSEECSAPSSTQETPMGEIDVKGLVQELRGHVTKRGGPARSDGVWSKILAAADLLESLSAENDRLRKDNEPSMTETLPIDMLLFCPRCGEQHVDEPHGDWENPPHRSHLCEVCGTIWRPADVPTNGVLMIATRGKADTWDNPAGRATRALPK